MTIVRLSSRKAAALVAAILLGSASCSSTGTSSSAPSASPSASASATPRVTATPAPTPIVVLPGEPWFAYHWYQDGKDTKDLFLVRPNGTDRHAIVIAVPGEHKGATWSPDGTKIAFEVFDGQTPGGSIWTANADGSGAKLLFDGGKACVGVVHPSWSPDGSKLVMVCYPGSLTASITILDIASNVLTTLVTVTWPEALDNAPRWSPNGASIAFPILHWDPTNDHLDGSLVAVVPAAGGQVHRLTTFDTFMSSPDWRPDGSELVMNSYDLGNIQATDHPSNVYGIKPDGTGLRQLTHRSVDGTMRITDPRPAPDGRRIYVSIANSIPPSTAVDCVQPASMDAGGGEPVLLWTSGECAAGAALRPTP
jgi:dipeptidyl aminopeptidase/acylaminoacyl peptidase